MVTQIPTIDSAKLVDGVTNFVKNEAGAQIKEKLDTANDFAKGAESFGIHGLGNLLTSLTNWIHDICAKYLGITLPEQSATAPATTANPANNPSNPAAAQLAAQTAAANNEALHDKNVATVEVPAVPNASQPRVPTK